MQIDVVKDTDVLRGKGKWDDLRAAFTALKDGDMLKIPLEEFAGTKSVPAMTIRFALSQWKGEFYTRTFGGHIYVGRKK